MFRHSHRASQSLATAYEKIARTTP
jgi:hypothetical protein